MRQWVAWQWKHSSLGAYQLRTLKPWCLHWQERWLASEKRLWVIRLLHVLSMKHCLLLFVLIMTSRQIIPGGAGGRANAGDLGDVGSDPRVRKAPWRRKWQPTPVLLPGESHRERNLVGYSPQGHKESNMTGRNKYAQVSILRLRKKKMSSASVMCLWPIHVTQPGTFPPDLAHNLCHTRTLRYQQQ